MDSEDDSQARLGDADSAAVALIPTNGFGLRFLAILNCWTRWGHF